MNQAHEKEAVDAFGIAVRSARLDQDLTQMQLAKKAHVSRQFVGELEAGHQRAELGKALSVIEALGIDVLTRLREQTPRPQRNVKLSSPSVEVPRRSGRSSTARSLALIEKGQELAGHHPSSEALDRARRVLDGEISAERARIELAEKYRNM